MVTVTIKNAITEALNALGLKADEVALEHPADMSNGDYSTNIALALSKKIGKKTQELAKDIVGELEKRAISDIHRDVHAVIGHFLKK